MKKIYFILFLILLNFNFAYADKDITNLKMKPSVNKGKIGKAYKIIETESGEPVIGQRAYKFLAIPFDCGHDGSKHTDCGEHKKKNKKSYLAKGDRVRSELSSGDNTFRGEHWFSFSIYIPKDYQSIYPTITSFYQIYEKNKGPVLKIEDHYGIMTASIMIKGKLITKKKLLKIDEMRGKWTHVIMHNKFSKKWDEGFYKFWINSDLKAGYKGETYAGSSKGLYVKAGIYQTYISRYLKVIGMDLNWKKGQPPGKFPTQIIYMDNIFKAKSEEILIKLINDAK
tara:strand:+ start:119 stop:967 length:849 start_codon:yes stop_codon:yes gene_type:complete